MNYTEKTKAELIDVIKGLKQNINSLKQEINKDKTLTEKPDKEVYESKKMLELVMDSIPQFIFWKDTNSVYLGCNENFAKAAGLNSADEIAGKTDYDLAWKKEEADFFIEVDKRVIESGIPEFHIIEPQLQADGKKAWLDTNKIPIKNNSGKIIGLLGTYEDITERKIAEEKLQQEKEFSKSAIDSLPGLFYMFDEKGRFIRWNSNLEKISGYSNEEIKKISALHFFEDEDKSKVSEAIKKTFSIGEAFVVADFISKSKIKTPTFFSGKLLLIDSNKYLVGMGIDISDQKKAEQGLYEAKQKAEESIKQLQLIANNFVNGMLYQVAMLDENKRQFNYVSDAVEKLYGCTADEAMKNPDLIYGKLHPDDIGDLIDTEKEALKNMSVFKTEARVINPDGSIRWSYYISRPRIIKGLVCWDGIEIDISDRKRMEFELRQAKERAEESEQQFRQLFENAADAIFIANENTGIILDVNRASENLMKMPKADIIGKHQSELHPPEVKDYASKTFSQHKQLEAENKLTRLIENKVLCSDGTSVPVEILASKVTFKGKKCLVGTFRDISERKKTEQELLKTKEKAEEINANLTAIIEGTNDSIWAFNKNYEILYINKSFQQEFLNSFGVLLEPGVNLIEALPQTLKPLWKPRYDKVLSNEHFSIEDAVDTKNGVVYIQVTFNPIVKNGEVIGGSCFGTNITSRKLAEIELLKAKEQAEESEMKFSKLFHISPEPQTVTSLDDGRFIMVNDSFLENIGYSKEEIINRTSIDINAWISPEDRQRWVDELKSKGAVRGLELPFRTRHQGIREYLVSSDIIDLDGKKSTINTYLDITERKQNEEELTKAKEKAEESDRLKTAFLQNMSHEIRTPMNAIMGFSQLLAENYDNKQKLEQFSKIIYQRCSDLLEIINDILNISKIESGQLALNIENCNINELFSELSLFYEELQKRISKQHIKLKFQHESNISHAIIQTDRVKLKQILINLISNAFKFTEFGSIECGYKQENNKLIFYVTDTGIGISKDKHELIFERFLQIHNRNVNNIGGTGLGLSIAKGLTELLGGEIWLESEPDKGTTFKFSINYIRSDKQEYKSVIQNENNELDFLNKTILIVEDDIYNAEYLNEILSETGINIIQTKFGKNAIEIAQIQDIDLILMDVRLPDLNGYEATKTIKHSNPDIIIIAQTAYAAQEEKQKALNAGCIDYISKPTKRDLLISLLNRYLKDDV